MNDTHAKRCASPLSADPAPIHGLRKDSSPSTALMNELVLDAEAFLQKLTGTVPKTSTGWLRAGIGFYRKKLNPPAVQCLERAVELDEINYEAWQILARAYLLQNRRKDAIAALKRSVRLNNTSDWQLLVELTNLEEAGAEKQ